MRPKRIILLTALSLLLLSGAGAMLFVYSGIYDIAASREHTKLVRTILLTVKREAIEFHASDIKVPELNDAELIRRGFVLYRQNCVTCHGAPGEARSRIGIGVNPFPPPLEKSVQQWTDAEIAWVIANGLKMAGMPAFGLGEDHSDIWAMTAFVKRMNTLSPAEYRLMQAAVASETQADVELWTWRDQGWDTLREKGDPARGQRLAYDLGCGSCHVIPNVPGARGMSGPPLANWKDRHYISGRLINSPGNLVKWIMHPQTIEPGTAMPNLNVTETEAWFIASYLYSLNE